MVAIKIAESASTDVSDITLKQAPARLLQFLQGVSDPVIRTKLASLPWSEERAKDGWALLEDLKATSIVSPSSAESPAKDAIEQCEQWQKAGIVQARALLQMTHPEQASFLFGDFVPGSGMGAVLNVATFLRRRELLARNPDRKATHKVDAEALAMLEQVGVTKDKVKELGALVETAHSVPEVMNEESANAEMEQARHETLRKIYVWITAWSDMARTVITRRDHAIRLGIAKRRAPKAKAVVVPPAPPVVTPPTPAPAPAPSSEDNGPASHAA